MTKTIAKTGILSLLAGGAAALLLASCATKEAPPPAVATAVPPPRTQAAPPAPPVQASIVPGSAKDFDVNVGAEVFFAYDQSNLDEAARGTLQKQAAWLERYKAVTVALQGNCDERGTREYNLALGARRAAAARDYLVSLGVSGARLTTVSFGKERPVCAESNEACWSKNRRDVSAIANAASPYVATRD